MTIQLLEGEFNANDAVELITKMIEVKIKFHESKISKSQQEEDIKSRENKIKALQNSLYDARTFLNSKNDSVNINSSLKIK
ncbi:hypothetical protein SAMN05444372_11746 [Flavobacterium micromati]|uniref:Uncharacterized protein n=1 Tax=Flavobacterium micromati TaxID=229205 RepID=A0A1M5QJN3_9FLAO|nr:hypothetical protein [Flavobacterium micromati]SHH14327.1 hypothetical protein SAMN05444372_11746 [Flavobacterium micromati]